MFLKFQVSLSRFDSLEGLVEVRSSLPFFQAVANSFWLCRSGKHDWLLSLYALQENSSQSVHRMFSWNEPSYVTTKLLRTSPFDDWRGDHASFRSSCEPAPLTIGEVTTLHLEALAFRWRTSYRLGTWLWSRVEKFKPNFWKVWCSIYTHLQLGDPNFFCFKPYSQNVSEDEKTCHK